VYAALHHITGIKAEKISVTVEYQTSGETQIKKMLMTQTKTPETWETKLIEALKKTSKPQQA
jgi:hypothetical protein